MWFLDVSRVEEVEVEVVKQLKHCRQPSKGWVYQCRYWASNSQLPSRKVRTIYNFNLNQISPDNDCCHET